MNTGKAHRRVLLTLAVSLLLLLTACGSGGAPPHNNPVPVVTSLQPSSASAGGLGFTLMVTGSNFISSSAVRWNGTTKSTTYVNSTTLSATISSADIASAGAAQVTVFNPAPGGGQSNALTFTINSANNPTPILISMLPNSTVAGGPAFTLVVSGTGFIGGSVVRWNGSNRSTTYVNPGELQASISASDIAAAGAAQITVSNPAPGGGVSNALPFNITGNGTVLNLPTNELLWDPMRHVIYASVPSRAGANGNSVATIDPVTASVVSYLWVGSEPRRLALSDDGQYLYVGLDGAAAVRRVNLTTQTPEIQFTLGSDSFLGPMYADDIEVMPGSPHTVAIARRNQGFSPRHMGVAIYDDGVMRPTTTPGHTGADVIEFGSTPDMLYGYNNETTEYGFRRMRVDESGVTTLDVATNLISGFDVDIEYEAGRVFSDNGRVIDPISDTVLGTYIPPQYMWFSAVRPETAADRVYFVSDPSYGKANLYAYVMDRFVPFGSMQVNASGYYASSLLRWGDDGLAFRTDSDQVVLARAAELVRVLPLEIATTQLPPTAGGKNYDYVLSASGGAPPVSWTVTGGALPEGLTLDTLGHITGTTAAIAADTTATFTAAATDTAPTTVSRAFSILVKAGSLGTNDTCATATPMSNGRIRASLSPYGDIDVYAFDGTAGATITAETFGDRLDLDGNPTTMDSFIDSFLEILDNNCTTLASNDDSGATTLDSAVAGFVLPYTGRYYVRVSDYRGDGRPDLIYELVLSGIK